VVSANGTNSPILIQGTAIIKNKYATVIVRRREQVQSLFVKVQCIICVSWLLLFRSLFTPCETALLETPIDTDGHVIWDLEGVDQGDSPGILYVQITHPSGNVGNLLETDISEGGLGDVRREPEDCRGNVRGQKRSGYGENPHR